ncbi:hypothetical protein HQ571_04405 [Candidatus Kuenenbacteria bacterium]|nr:hypothetical protein [Candidatus Kuenenbacteria bacterium]
MTPEERPRIEVAGKGPGKWEILIEASQHPNQAFPFQRKGLANAFVEAKIHGAHWISDTTQFTVCPELESDVVILWGQFVDRIKILDILELDQTMLEIYPNWHGAFWGSYDYRLRRGVLEPIFKPIELSSTMNPRLAKALPLHFIQAQEAVPSRLAKYWEPTGPTLEQKLEILKRFIEDQNISQSTKRVLAWLIDRSDKLQKDVVLHFEDDMLELGKTVTRETHRLNSSSHDFDLHGFLKELVLDCHFGDGGYKNRISVFLTPGFCSLGDCKSKPIILRSETDLVKREITTTSMTHEEKIQTLRRFIIEMEDVSDFCKKALLYLIKRSDGLKNDTCLVMTGQNEDIGRQIAVAVEEMNSSSGRIRVDLFLKKMGMNNWLACRQQDFGTANRYAYFIFCSQGHYYPEEKNLHDQIVYISKEDLEPIYDMELTV